MSKRTAAFLLMAATLVVSCNASTPSHGGPRPAVRRPMFSPGGVLVQVPSWLPDGHALLPRLFREVDTTPAEGSSQTLPTSGYTVAICAPGSFEAPASPTGLARGQLCYEHRVIWVSWRGPGEKRTDPDGPLLPALGHEVAHVFHGPNANHGRTR